MKNLFLTVVLFVAFSTVNAQEEKLHFKHKSEVMTLLTLDEEIVNLTSGESLDSAFYYAAWLDKDNFIGYYFDEYDTCNLIVHFHNFSTYRKKLKRFTRESKYENSNVTSTEANKFVLKNPYYSAMFVIKGDAYMIKWGDIDYDRRSMTRFVNELFK